MGKFMLSAVLWVVLISMVEGMAPGAGMNATGRIVPAKVQAHRARCIRNMRKWERRPHGSAPPRDSTEFVDTNVWEPVPVATAAAIVAELEILKVREPAQVEYLLKHKYKISLMNKMIYRKKRKSIAQAPLNFTETKIYEHDRKPGEERGKLYSRSSKVESNLDIYDPPREEINVEDQ